MASSNFVFVAEQIQDPRRNQMFNSQSIQLSRTRYLVAATVLLVLLAAAPLAVDASSYSGDGTYDRAAGGFPELFLTSVPTSYSGDDAYDQAAGGIPELFVVAAVWSLSGDDAYDPAAGGLSELAGNAIEASYSNAVACGSIAVSSVGIYSGDDAYDPAAGGNPDGPSLELACAQ
jgi:hypothetical protein